jgi:glycosyltransferase involved in cell wall biosynthesis
MDPVKQPRVSVITVLYNSASTIERTVKSVLEQSYSNIEFIVIDGKSNDGSVEILNRYRDHFDVLISEPDKGIYDAMNKGINLATGDWICFMNSNDYFFDRKVVEEIIGRCSGSAGIVYGYCIDPDTGKEIKPLSLDDFWRRIPLNHQSAFVKSMYYREHPYDLRYRISSVYDFFYYWYCKGVKFEYIDIPVAVYNMKGISFYSYLWLWDYLRISMKYSGGKRIRVFLRFVYLVFVRIYVNIFKRRGGLKSVNRPD